tara:strand:- start:48 stop:311 length:264 start_codon:yes stop_codon:yes gene_type:complete
MKKNNNINYSFLKNLSVKINRTPIIAGKIKLTNHSTKVAERTPLIFKESNPNKYTATDPLTPISVSAIVGIMDTISNMFIINTIASI